ncbi:MAG: hypothetical protein ABI442_01610 [Gemmatimonadaceae bacterium]
MDAKPVAATWDPAKLGRFALTILLALYGMSILRNPAGGSFVDSIDLPIHETGHLVFGPFGEFIGFLGGTLFQLIMPSVFVGYFVRRKDLHAASVALWWVAQNFWNISVYVRDARAQELPLVGGGEHDWAYILGRIGSLQHDQIIAQRFWGVGVILFFFSIGGGLIALTGPKSPSKGDEPLSTT